MKHLARPIATSLLLATTALAQITPGNLVVTRVGDGTAALSNAATAVFLEEYTKSGALVQTIAMPTAPAGGNFAMTWSGTATSEGAITQSVDGRYLLLVGYNAAPGTPSVATTASAATARIIGRVALGGAIDTTTALSDAYTGSNIRSACSTDGSVFWTAGASSVTGGGGMRYSLLGATTSTSLTVVNNTRVTGIFAGQLYCSSASGTLQGVGAVGVGTPTTTGQTITSLPGFPTASGPSAYDFEFADANTLYVADDRTNGNGGIQKWTLVGGTWTLQYTLAPATNIGCRSLSIDVEGGLATIFATATNNQVVRVVDAGAGSPFTTLVTGVANTALRGVQSVRTPANIVHSGTACATSVGVPTIGTNGPAVAGNLGFQITSGNNPVPTIVMFSLRVGPSSPIGIPVPGTPPCVLVYALPDLLLAELADPLGNAFTALPLPANASLGGFQLSAQAFPFDLSLVGFSLPIGASDALDLTLGN